MTKQELTKCLSKKEMAKAALRIKLKAVDEGRYWD